MGELDAFVKGFGFESEKEFHNLRANTDLSTQEKIKAFKEWQYNDGTKKGLQELIDKNK